METRSKFLKMQRALNLFAITIFCNSTLTEEEQEKEYCKIYEDFGIDSDIACAHLYEWLTIWWLDFAIMYWIKRNEANAEAGINIQKESNEKTGNNTSKLVGIN